MLYFLYTCKKKSHSALFSSFVEFEPNKIKHQKIPDLFPRAYLVLLNGLHAFTAISYNILFIHNKVISYATDPNSYKLMYELKKNHFNIFNIDQRQPI